MLLNSSTRQEEAFACGQQARLAAGEAHLERYTGLGLDGHVQLRRDVVLVACVLKREK